LIAAVDTNILLDILIPDETHFADSKKLLDEYILKGQLIICEVVYAELASQFLSAKELQSFISDTGIRLVHSNEAILHLAGERWKSYLKNRKQTLLCPQCGREMEINCPSCKSPFRLRQRVLSDFIIGAHALVHTALLLTRDRGFYKTYFRDLKIVGGK